MRYTALQPDKERDQCHLIRLAIRKASPWERFGADQLLRAVAPASAAFASGRRGTGLFEGSKVGGLGFGFDLILRVRVRGLSWGGVGYRFAATVE